MIYKYISDKEYCYDDFIIAKPGETLEITPKELKNLQRPVCITNIPQCVFKDLKSKLQPIVEDKVNHPNHYTWLKELCGIEVIDITRHMDFDCGNAIKYILRCGHKSEAGYSNKEKMIEDLKKAVWYLNDKINTLENAK